MGIFDGYGEDDLKPMNDFTPVPAGNYTMAATGCEWKNCGATAKDPNGRYLKFTVEIIDGEFKGRKIWPNLSLENSNAQTVNMARRELAEMARAVGRMSAKSESDLLNIPFTAEIGVRAASGNFEASNVIKHYLPMGGAKTAAAPINIQTQPSPVSVNAEAIPINPATGQQYKPWENWPGKGA